MTWGDLMEWVAYSELEPFGEERADWRSGMVASVVANVNRDPKRGRPFQPKDFMPQFDEKAARSAARKPLLGTEQWSDVKRMAKIYGAVKES